MSQTFLSLVTAGWVTGIALGQTGLASGLPLLMLMFPALLVVAMFRRAAPSLFLACFAGWAVGHASLPPEDTAIERLAIDVAVCDVRGSVVERVGVFGTTVALTEAVCDKGSLSGRLGNVVIDGAPGEPGSGLIAAGRFIPLGSDGFSLARRRAGALAEFAPSEIIFAPPRGAARVAASIRASARRAVSGLGPRQQALSMGLVVGDTSGFDPETEDSFRRAGLSHLVAVSGSNVAIVLGAVLLVAARLPLRPRVGLAALALGLFVLTVGPEPSVLRAAAMGGVALSALLVGRRSEPLLALCVAALVLTALRPSLVFAVGFWLSVGATVGIVLWARPLAETLERTIGGGGWRAALAAAFGVTCAAQFAVAPLLAIVFGKVSLVGPLANLLAVPAVPIATILGFTSALLGLVSPPVAALTARLSQPFLGWILWVADTSGRAPWADVDVPARLGFLFAGLVVVAAAGTLRSGGLTLRP